jgi:hypothetical protein
MAGSEFIFDIYIIYIYGGFPLVLDFFECVAKVGDSPKFFKILRIEMENYPILVTMGMY